MCVIDTASQIRVSTTLSLCLVVGDSDWVAIWIRVVGQNLFAVTSVTIMSTPPDRSTLDLLFTCSLVRVSRASAAATDPASSVDNGAASLRLIDVMLSSTLQVRLSDDTEGIRHRVEPEHSSLADIEELVSRVSEPRPNACVSFESGLDGIDNVGLCHEVRHEVIVVESDVVDPLVAEAGPESGRVAGSPCHRTPRWRRVASNVVRGRPREESFIVRKMYGGVVVEHQKAVSSKDSVRFGKSAPDRTSAPPSSL